MAQHKYDLVTLPTRPADPPRHHPWYKERLDLKYTKRGQKSGCLDGRKWTLLAGNMDDFRTGLPALVAPGSMVRKGKVDPFPLVNSSEPRVKRSLPPPAPQRHDPGQSTLHSKIGPQRQSKLARLRQAEHQLLQQPLSLYPHLRDSVPPEVAGNLLSILEGQTQTQRVSKVDQSLSTNKEESKSEEDNEHQEEEEEDESDGVRNIIYRWPLRQTEEEVKEEQRAVAAQKVISPAQEARVNQVTQNLVQWGRELGGSGESPDIDEATVKNLFSSDCESRPMTTPERVVDLSNVPHELLRDTSARFSAGSQRSSPSVWDTDPRRRSLTAPMLSSDMNVYSKSHAVKSRYGAWYLPIGLWKLQKADEPLRDPRNCTSESTEELARQDQELDLMVSQLHGAHAFRHYYSSHKPGSTLPSFLQCTLAENSSSQNIHESTRRNKTFS